MRRVTIAGLLRMEMPGGTVRLCDGGTVIYGGERYRAADPVYGTFSGIQAFEEGVGEDAPGGTITLLPSPAVAAADLLDPATQGCSVKGWIVELDAETGEVVPGTDVQELDAMLDVPWNGVDRGQRSLSLDYIPLAEWLFLVNRGNTLSTTFHQSIYPGEQGYDNATGVGAQVAWGAPNPPSGSSRFGGGPVGVVFDNMMQ